EWVRSSTGSPTLADVTQLEIHQDTWDYGFTVYYDGVEFASLARGGNPAPPSGVNPDAMSPRTLLYIYHPIIEHKGRQRMDNAYGWNDPATLTEQIVNDLQVNSHGLANYQVVDTQIVDAYPYLLDGFRYDDVTYDQAITTHQFHDSGFDYNRFIADNNLAT